MNLIFFPRTALSSACMAAWFNLFQSKANIQRIFLILDSNNEIFVNKLITIYWKDMKTEILYFKYPSSYNVYKYSLNLKSIFKSLKIVKQNYQVEFTRIQDELKPLIGIPFKYICFTNSFPIEMFMKALDVDNCLYFEHGVGDLVQRKVDSQMFRRFTYIMRSILEIVLLNQYKFFRPNIHYYTIFSEFIEKLPKNVHRISIASLTTLFKSGSKVIASDVSEIRSKKFSYIFNSMIIIPNYPGADKLYFYNFIRDALKLADGNSLGSNILIKLSPDQFFEQLNTVRNVLSDSIFSNNFVIIDDQRMNYIAAENLCLIFSISTIFSVGYTTSLFLKITGYDTRSISLVPLYKTHLDINGDLSDNKLVKAGLREFENYERYLLFQS
jgi:hypothetical protein